MDLEKIRKENTKFFEDLKNAYESNIISPDEVQKKITLKREKIIKKHAENHSIWQGCTNHRWYTYLPDGSPKGRKVAKTNLEDLHEAIVNFYREQDLKTIRSLYPELLKRKKLEHAADSTIDRYRTTWEKYLEHDHDLVDKPITKLTKGYCKEWTLIFLDANPMKRKCYNNVKTVISQILELATDRDYISKNVYRSISIPANCFLDDDSVIDDEVFTDEEMQKVIAYLWSRYEKDRTRTAPLAILFVFVTGLRVGELEALKFSDIDENYFLRIRRQQVRKFDENGKLSEYQFVEHAKSRSRKKPIFIPSAGQYILSLVKESNELNGDGADGFVFYNCHKHMSTAVLNRLLETACKSTGVKVRRMHKVRKTYASILASNLENGITLPMITTAMGHANSAVTFQNYVRDRGTEKEMASAIERIFQSVTRCNTFSQSQKAPIS